MLAEYILINDPKEVSFGVSNVINDERPIEEVESDEEDSLGIFIRFGKFQGRIFF